MRVKRATESGSAGPDGDTARPRHAGPAVTLLLTSAMAFSMMQLFLIGALGPRLVGELGISRTVLGLTTTAGFGAAALLSPAAGRLVDRVGPRRCLVALLLLAAVSLALIGAAPGTAVLLLAVALGGLPQALANPATNKLILAAVPAEQRGGVTGLKQSGVQFGAFVAGLPLSLLAAGVGWRGAVWTAAGTAALAAVWAALVLPPDAIAAAPCSRPPRPVRGLTRQLAVFSLLLGCGIASVNTYLALFGSQRLGLSPTTAAALVAVLGVAGIGGRMGWSRVAGRPGRAEALPALLAAGAVGAALLLAVAVLAPPLVWVAAIAVGSFAVSANAVSMVLVLQRAAPGRAGQDSALVSAGFFAGFAVGPPLFGALVSATGYGPGWLLVAAEFAGAAVVAVPLRSRRQEEDG
ncbi:Predicted arabinose efflux permease, MFS family [Streptomyces sp. 2112.3]|nr:MULTISPECIES: MFS transporter [unclassified Streptomyces]SDR57987.1 Predicted arabinose efflux permease, MFS family [Streptomyces sp. KS_16]SEB80799.1 Predicted arabinose efflux permease, MFS family [Streptomyces sp. 2133.1]SEF13857.1 Predicted arabinose efflux permease, MFS family [Streptomyces sp. 2112.3]PBC80590.1 putative MFS family arabinose efflux permease [Streptomyces sp. 2321.6]SNC61181.1 Predicted arabinose efflux permease, MFS family [Streptomyces sp. 2114.4]